MLFHSVVFQALQKKEADNILLVPEAQNFTAFDGFMWLARLSKWIPLQVTIDANKTLQLKHLKNFAESNPSVLDSGKLHWYAVAPPSIAVKGKSFKFAEAEHLDWAKENVVQHVIPFARLGDDLSDYCIEDRLVLRRMAVDCLSTAARIGVTGSRSKGDSERAS